MTDLQAPFPYFGGKSRISADVWAALGQPKHYIEPFFGSGAVLLARPDYDPTTHMETICDKDGYVANAWRAMQHDPDEVAKWCDWPVNHADLSARKRKLLANRETLLAGLIEDDDWCDPKLAGYWIWAASCWIGSGLTSLGQRPHVSHGGTGVHKLGQIPHVGHGGKGVHKIGKRPHVSDGGKGVHRLGQRPHVSDGRKGVREPYNANLYTWFRELSERLRYVRVVCGDWSRVCGGNWQDKMGVCGMFFDPPYGVKDRDEVYDTDSYTVAAKVTAWARERGRMKRYRIVLAGYEEHAELEADGWRVKQWSARGGYANSKRNEDSEAVGMANRHRERLYFSPHCLTADGLSLFDAEKGGAR